MTKVPLLAHQIETANFFSQHPRAFCTSTPGTGKTLSMLAAHHRNTEGQMLVIAPKSTLEAVWGNDIAKFYPKTTYGIFSRKELKKDPDNYLENLLNDNEITIFNIEATDLLLNNYKLIERLYSTIVIDEFTSVKNRTTQRSKRMRKLVKAFQYRYFLSGTPTPNGIVDIWHPALLADDGVRLGSNFFYFRNSVCQPVLKGINRPFTEWVEIPGAADVVANTLKEITIMHELEKVQDMPERVYRTLEITMPSALRSKYEEFKKTSILALTENVLITAVNKAVLGNKLLQLASGTIYTGSFVEDSIAKAVNFHHERIDLIVQLVKERKHSIVFFMWKHQRNALVEQLDKDKITYVVIDGSTSSVNRALYISQYQDGKYQTILIQPAAAAHGITLTRSQATIWCSPTWNLELFIQANYRDYRIGQNKRTEVIMIQYKNTIEEQVYKALQNKRSALDSLLNILKS